MFQNYTFLGRSGHGPDPRLGGNVLGGQRRVHGDAGATRRGGAGDLTRWLRTENLYYSSSRHHYGAWMLAQYIKDRDGIAMFNRIWNEARNTEHPLEVYRRITGITQAELNRRIGEYAQHNVTWDYSQPGRLHAVHPKRLRRGFSQRLQGGTGRGRQRVACGTTASPTPWRRQDYGYNKIRLVPDSDGALIRLHLKGHAETGANGWTLRLRRGAQRRARATAPLSQATDGQISFQTQSGESQVFLVVTGTPTAVPKYAFLDGWPRNRRYPYEFRISGAIPDRASARLLRSRPPVGGRWHANGGGWVAQRCQRRRVGVCRPARRGVQRQRHRQRAHRGSRLGQRRDGDRQRHRAPQRHRPRRRHRRRQRVVGGDAEPPAGPTGGSCTSGTYLMFNPSRGCNGGGGEADINPAHGTFTSEELAITGNPNPSPTPTPTPSPASPNPNANLARSATASCSFTSSWESCAAINNGDEPTQLQLRRHQPGQPLGHLAQPGRAVGGAHLVGAGDALPGAGVLLRRQPGHRPAVIVAAAVLERQRLRRRRRRQRVSRHGQPIQHGHLHRVSTTRLRVLLQSAPNFSVGLLEVKAFTPSS